MAAAQLAGPSTTQQQATTQQAAGKGAAVFGLAPSAATARVFKQPAPLRREGGEEEAPPRAKPPNRVHYRAQAAYLTRMGTAPDAAVAVGTTLVPVWAGPPLAESPLADVAAGTASDVPAGTASDTASALDAAAAAAVAAASDAAPAGTASDAAAAVGITSAAAAAVGAAAGDPASATTNDIMSESSDEEEADDGVQCVVLRPLPCDELKCNPWAVTWASELGPCFWFFYGVVDVTWPDATEEQQLDAVELGLLGSLRPHSTNHFSGQIAKGPKWVFETFNIHGNGGVRGAARALLEVWENGGKDRAKVEGMLRPTGVAPIPPRSSMVQGVVIRMEDDLKQMAAPGRLGKGIKAVPPKESHKGKVYYNAKFLLEKGGATMLLYGSYQSEEVAVNLCAHFFARLELDGFSVAWILDRPQQRYQGYGPMIMANFMTALPEMDEWHAVRLTARAQGVKARLTNWYCQGTYVLGLSAFHLADICLAGEKAFAIAMTKCVDCVGRPRVNTYGGGNTCPHAANREQYDWFRRWERMEFDHGPIAEVKDISTALSGLLSGDGAAPLAQLNGPLFRHVMYGTEWIQLPDERGNPVLICPNVAPRCSHASAKRLCTPEEVPKRRGCHLHTGHGWATDLMLSTAVQPGVTLLPFTAGVLRSSPQGPGILSAEAATYLRSRSTIWTAMALVPKAPAVDAFDPSAAPPAGSSSADPLARLVCAALILRVQQSALLDLVHLATLLCFLLILAMTESVLLHTPRRALLYLCYNAESFTFMIGAGIGGAADGYAAASFMLAATGRPRLAMLCYLTSVAVQLERISEQPWDVLLTAALLRIGFKVATSKCLAWLVRHCSKQRAPADAVSSVVLLLA